MRKIYGVGFLVGKNFLFNQKIVPYTSGPKGNPYMHKLLAGSMENEVPSQLKRTASIASGIDMRTIPK